jgi:type VI secretion system protein ImpH
MTIALTDGLPERVAERLVRTPSPGLVRPSVHTGMLEQRLFEEPFCFDFFQAVRLLSRLNPAARPVGSPLQHGEEVVRFRARLSLAFPPSAIHDLSRPRHPLDYGLHALEPAPSGIGHTPVMTVAFLGLTGPSGVLPRHYTELLLALDQKSDRQLRERNALRAWFDLFNHRLISLFYQAWEKYRFYIAYERESFRPLEPDPFTRSLFSLIGLGLPALRGRLRVDVRPEAEPPKQAKPLAEIDDLSLLFHSGVLAHRPRCAESLRALLEEYFQLPLVVQQFSGQWLYLDSANQSRMQKGSSRLGVDVVVGARVWDDQSKFRVRIGPLSYQKFVEFLPDPSPAGPSKAFFLLCHLIRLYVGPELDFDIQLVLAKEDVPGIELARGERCPRLGWNTWLPARARARDADDAVFEGQEVVWLDRAPRQ